MLPDYLAGICCPWHWAGVVAKAPFLARSLAKHRANGANSVGVIRGSPVMIRDHTVHCK